MIHITGSRDYDEVAGSLGGIERYSLVEYEPDLGAALAASDLVLARAGGSVYELTAAGRPAILVPYPHATARHQHANAEWMRRTGAAEVSDDVDLSPARLARELPSCSATTRVWSDGEGLAIAGHSPMPRRGSRLRSERMSELSTRRRRGSAMPSGAALHRDRRRRD